jgi:DNA-binding PadR family transcriptional regulator
MQEIEQRSEGRWSPSAGSIYPTLEQLADEGLVRAADDDGRKRYELTDAGRDAVEAAADQPAPWDPDGDEDDDLHHQLGKATMSLAAAVRQVAHAGSQAQQEQVLAMLAESRRSIYAILADDEA